VINPLRDSKLSGAFRFQHVADRAAQSKQSVKHLVQRDVGGSGLHSGDRSSLACDAPLRHMVIACPVPSTKSTMKSAADRLRIGLTLSLFLDTKNSLSVRPSNKQESTRACGPGLSRGLQEESELHALPATRPWSVTPSERTKGETRTPPRHDRRIATAIRRS
jgi:hypothetical protein